MNRVVNQIVWFDELFHVGSPREFDLSASAVAVVSDWVRRSKKLLEFDRIFRHGFISRVEHIAADLFSAISCE